MTPLSEGGKVFCIIYAAVGIPLTLIMFTALVERLMIVTGKLKLWLAARLGPSVKAVHVRLIHVTIIFLFTISFLYLLPAAVFMVLEEDWNYLDAFYYCFISLTSIGLGDYIPGDDHGQKHRQLYKILTTSQYRLHALHLGSSISITCNCGSCAIENMMHVHAPTCIRRCMYVCVNAHFSIEVLSVAYSVGVYALFCLLVLA